MPTQKPTFLHFRALYLTPSVRVNARKRKKINGIKHLDQTLEHFLERKLFRTKHLQGAVKLLCEQAEGFPGERNVAGGRPNGAQLFK